MFSANREAWSPFIPGENYRGLCGVSTAHTDPQLHCRVYQCGHCQEQLQPTAERAIILPALSIVTTHFAPPTWFAAQHPEAFQVFQSFRDMSAWRPDSPAQRIPQVWTSNWFPCCATEGLQGWVSPKVSVSSPFVLLQWHLPHSIVGSWHRDEDPIQVNT